MTPRRATPDDIDEVLRLAAQMYETLGRPPGAEWDANARALLAERLGGEDLTVFVVDGEVPGRLVACGAGLIVQRLPMSRNPSGRFGFVQWMLTEPEHRGRGLARAIMDALLAWFDERGVTVAELHASPYGEPLYRSLGFQEPRMPYLMRWRS